MGTFSSFLTHGKRKEEKGGEIVERYLSSLVPRPLPHCKIIRLATGSDVVEVKEWTDGDLSNNFTILTV